MGNREYASKEYVEELYFRKDNDFIYDFITFRDKTTGAIYYGYIKDGVWTTSCKINEVHLNTMPNKTHYIYGEIFDSTGMELVISFDDGTKSIVGDIVVSEIPVFDSSIKFPYVDKISGVTYEITVEGLTIEEFDPEIQLVDFDYIANDDGTYTLTGWKETLNGELSTELIIPNNNLIII